MIAEHFQEMRLELDGELSLFSQDKDPTVLPRPCLSFEETKPFVSVGKGRHSGGRLRNSSKTKSSKADGKTKKLGFVDEPCEFVLSSRVQTSKTASSPAIRHDQSPLNIPRKVQLITDLISSEMMSFLQYSHKGPYRRVLRHF